MFPEKKFINPEKEQEPVVIIKRSTDTPPEVKENPFYNPEFWGRANSIDDIYLPDSDEAISFAVAAHEIGHIIEKGRRDDASLDNFEATRAEEQRAWDKGWEYLQKYLAEYYKEKPEIAFKIQQAFDQIRGLFMKAVDLSESMYLESGTLNNLDPEEIDRILKEKREKLFSARGEEFKQLFEEIKHEKIGVKPDWGKFTSAVRKAVQDILRDNAKKPI